VAGSSLRRAVFLDRDGTLNVDTGYVASASDVRLIPGAAQGAKRLADAGYALVIASNQSGVARGMMTEAMADAVDARLLELLREHGVSIEASYRCPHLPGGEVQRYAVECECRKPKPGMLVQAARELGLDLASSWMVGDGERDVEAGLAAGTRAVLIGGHDEHAADAARVYRAKDLLDAACIITTKG
jgi:D-glycero-D-manno-heptose 1,7-bisphosphate phosphatase